MRQQPVRFDAFKKVHFYQSSFEIPVYHWDSAVPKRISVTDITSVSLDDFRIHVRLAFDEDIKTEQFSIYEYPRNFNSPTDPGRKRITTSESLRETLSKFCDADHFPPLIYVWNEPVGMVHQSPTAETIPVRNEVLSDTYSCSSRDSETSK